MTRGYLTRGEQATMFVLIFFILQEWLRPIMELTGTGYFHYFALFIAICLALALFQLPIWLTSLIKVMYIFWFIEFIYNKTNVFFLSFYASEVSYNAQQIISGDFAFVSDGFRTLLFLLLIWMLVYLVHHWITVRISIFYFLLLTIFFIATLDTYSDYDGKLAIVKVIVIGLIMTAYLFMKRLIMERNILIDQQSLLKFMLPVLLFVGLFSAIAFELPKASPQWPDPIPFVKGIGNGNGESLFGKGEGASSKKVGYGTNDERLGGSFEQDDTVVFQVEAQGEEYWRVEVKDEYTSRGWVASKEGENLASYSMYNELNLSIKPGEASEVQVAHITNLSSHNFAIQPYGVMNYEFGSSDTLAEVDVDTEKIFPVVGTSKVTRPNYTVLYSKPIYNYSALKEVLFEPSDDERYLQLPDALPQRVRDLALQITESSTSTYDKAKAIEKYFVRNGFRYETQDVAIPGRGEDYVDQFLFETKMGYCDNFSTAMVVMLRAADIPARWVKGFVTGDQVNVDASGTRTYEITNNEAHSWVEAYIEGIGWVPFEPTIGYSSPAQIDYDTKIPDDVKEPELPEDKEDTIEEPKEPEEKEEKPKEKDAVGAAGDQASFINWKLVRTIGLIVLGVLLIAAIVLALTRNKWLPSYYISQNKKQSNSRKNYIQSYNRLLKQLSAYGLTRDKNQTLAKYAKRVDRHFDTTEMSELTEVYEKLVYAKDVDENQFEELREVWESLMSKTKK